MKNVYLILALALSQVIDAQVGVNTLTPTSTLDVRGQTTATSIDGLQAPRLSRADLTSKNASVYGNNQKGALIYVTDISGGDIVGSRINIKSIGYYYFDGSIWIPLSTSNIYTNDGAISGNRVVTQGNNTLTFNSTIANGTKFYTDGTIAAPKAALQIKDGTEGLNKILTSDAVGNAIWKTPGLNVVAGNLPANGPDFSQPGKEFLYTGGSITLPPGKWQVAIGTTAALKDNVIILDMNQLWVGGTLSDVTSTTGSTLPYSTDLIRTAAAPSGFRVATAISTGMTKNSLLGYVLIENKTAAAKTYHLWAFEDNIIPDKPTGKVNGLATNPSVTAHWTNAFGSGSFERTFFAIPAQ